VPFRPEVIVADRPAIAPLLGVFDDFKRIAVCLVDRRGAKLYEYFMGRMEEIWVLSDDVPGRMKFAGWGGYEEGHIQRHVLAHEYAHFKNVAEVLFEQFKVRGFDWLFLGIKTEAREEMERTLHTYVRERLKGYIEVAPPATDAKVKRLTQELAQKLKSEDDAKLAERLVQTASGRGLAVAGLQKTLEAINMAGVATLVVKRGASQKGLVCQGCGMLGLKRSDCRNCGDGMEQIDNVIERAEAAAVAQGAVVRHISADSVLDKADGIGAFVRFPLRAGK
jgi:peptide chain release factor subunit 1